MTRIAGELGALGQTWESGATLGRVTAAERILAEALALPDDERVALAERLLALTPDPHVDQAWAEEANRRLEDYKNGDEPGMTIEEALRFMVSTQR